MRPAAWSRSRQVGLGPARGASTTSDHTRPPGRACCRAQIRASTSSRRHAGSRPPVWPRSASDHLLRARQAHKRIGLIVLETHGRTGVSHALLGSVAESVVRLAPCPVFTILTGDHGQRTAKARSSSSVAPTTMLPLSSTPLSSTKSSRGVAPHAVAPLFSGWADVGSARVQCSPSLPTIALVSRSPMGQPPGQPPPLPHRRPRRVPGIRSSAARGHPYHEAPSQAGAHAEGCSGRRRSFMARHGTHARRRRSSLRPRAGWSWGRSRPPSRRMTPASRRSLPSTTWSSASSLG